MTAYVSNLRSYECNCREGHQWRGKSFPRRYRIVQATTRQAAPAKVMTWLRDQECQREISDELTAAKTAGFHHVYVVLPSSAPQIGDPADPQLSTQTISPMRHLTNETCERQHSEGNAHASSAVYSAMSTSEQRAVRTRSPQSCPQGPQPTGHSGQYLSSVSAWNR